MQKSLPALSAILVAAALWGHCSAKNARARTFANLSANTVFASTAIPIRIQSAARQVQAFGESGAEQPNWCGTAACGNKHTMCQYSGPKRSCQRVNEVCTALTSVKLQSMLAAHNEIRSKVAGGIFKAADNAKLPAAMKMYQLKWDSNLAKTATRWAQQCNIRSDECRADVNGTFAEVRQNMWGIQSDLKSLKDPQHAVNNPCRAALSSWTGQRSKVTWKKVQEVTPSFNQPGGQLMMMMAGEAAALGCGQCAWKEGKMVKATCFCYYGMIEKTSAGPLYLGTLNEALIGDQCPTEPMDNLCLKL